MKIVAVTSCPSGVAHTYMAAEALEIEAKARGIEIKVETQGSIGIENKITMDDVKNADIAILTNDVVIKESERFKGLPIVKVGVSDVVKKTPNILDRIEVYLKSKQK
jgi:fructose-specific PTS system IIB-like component